ncbi:hypothetical protein FHQ26_09560 [Testudinibacter sp. TR-2022]|uniref:hypothetical protein n=1 Tax=Testudinibacter sp. TR-2022 TaxID=2585029 RepID=UPI001118E4C5|nr:hypothetical protein [Testudinibacter sp. TR-2022]TNH03480.1 hypothetical protein FHQ22_07930 [Pasteurellaceae bacterium Phil31]TNH07947.1 hypothetical protein FHQ26_09560 [Testudinibacter sp. TR-2022]TNH10316.1 hypothetical protein FHQ25_05450 [Testudinibacter sp. TR-2022]
MNTETNTPLFIIKKPRYPFFKLFFEDKYRFYYAVFLDENRYFVVNYNIADMDTLLAFITEQQQTCGIPLEVTSKELKLMKLATIPRRLIRLDKEESPGEKKLRRLASAFVH